MPATVLEYNGQRMELGEVLSFSQRYVYDSSGVRYLYTHFRISVRVIIHDLATWPLEPGGDPSIPREVGARSQLGFPPNPDNVARAVALLRDRLKTPRQVLRVPIGGGRVLESPQLIRGGVERLNTDANNGPVPLDFRVEKIIGTRTVVGVFSVETWLNEAETGEFEDRPPPTILSNQWSMSEDYDDVYLSTINVSGTATFRSDFLQRSAPTLTPDEFRRAYLLHPVPAHYRRAGMRVQQGEDGTSVRYQVVYREMPWGLRGVRRVSHSVRQHYSWISLTNPTFTREWACTVHGYPYSTSRDVVRALERVLATSTTNAGVPVFTAWHGGGAFAVPVPDFLRAAGLAGGLTRFPLAALDVSVERDTDGSPSATAVFRADLGKSLGPIAAGAGILFDAGFTADIYPENAGVVGGPATSTSTDLPRPETLRGNQLVALVSQAITNDPYTRPPLPPATRRPRDAF